MHHRNVFSLYLLQKVHRLNYFAASCFFYLILSLFQFLCESFAKSFTNHFYAYLNVKSTFHSQCEIVSFLMKNCNHSSHDKPVVSAKGSYFGTSPYMSRVTKCGVETAFTTLKNNLKKIYKNNS